MNHLHCRIFYRDEDYLREIRAGGSRAEMAISCLYLKYRKRTITHLKKVVAKHTEFKAVPEDLLHDSFIVMLDKIMDSSCEIRTLAGFWVGIGKHLLLNQLKKDQRIILINDMEEIYETQAENMEWVVYDTDEDELLEKAFASLGARCKEILLLWINRHTMTEIAQVMKLSNAAMARKTKYECFKKLKELVRTGYIAGD